MVLGNGGFGDLGAVAFNFDGVACAGDADGSTEAVLDVSGVVDSAVGGTVEVGSGALHEDHLGGISLALLKHTVLELDKGGFHDDGSAVVLQELIVVLHGHLS
jgi:hypothetical protein